MVPIVCRGGGRRVGEDLLLVTGMTERNRKRLLWAVNAVLALAILASGGLALAPLGPSVRDAPAPAPAPAVAAAETPPVPLDAYDVICQRDLRGPLFDTAAPQAAPAAPMPPFHLTGTAVEPGFSFGLFRNSQGESKMVGVGESIDGAELVAVTEQAVTLKFGGRSVTMTVEKEGTSTGATPAGPGIPVGRRPPRLVPRVGPEAPFGGAAVPGTAVPAALPGPASASPATAPAAPAPPAASVPPAAGTPEPSMVPPAVPAKEQKAPPPAAPETPEESAP